MNLKRLEAAVAPEDLPFCRAVVKRLARILPTPLDEPDAQMLETLLSSYTIHFRDGFKLNTDDASAIISRTDAAIILSALCDDITYDWKAWRAILNGGGTWGREKSAWMECLVGRIFMSRDVVSISK